MNKKTIRQFGDKTPPTGGVPIPAHLVRTLPDSDDAPDDDLGRQAFWLLKLHADKLNLDLAASDIRGMDDDAKRQLISDIQRRLGIAPLKSDVL